jgi:glycosyltransferase involved in cell wall biosynthesis
MYVAAHNGAHVWGGAERGVAWILAGLQERGHRVRLFCNDRLVAEGARALGVPAEILPLGGDVAVHHAVRFAWALRRDPPDALIVGTFRKLWLAAFAGRLAGVRTIARIGLETDTPRSAKYRWVLTHWTHTIVLKADDVRGAYLRALPGLDPARLITVPGGVERPLPGRSPGSVRAELGIPEEALVIGSLGRLAEQKRFDRLLHAVALLPDDVHCIVAGEGSEHVALRELAADLGIAERVHLVGHRDDVGDVLAALDVFVVSSDREMLSFAMLEALAAGVPVVSTQVSGAASALAAAPNGIAPGAVVGFDAAEIAAAVSRLLSDPERLREMGEAARRRAGEHYGREVMLEGWEAVLNGVAEPSPAGVKS